MNPGKNGTLDTPVLGIPKRLICLGYYDGPTEGVVQYVEPDRVFLFRWADSAEAATQDELREFILQPLPCDALNRMAAAISPYIEPAWPIWFPSWKFPSPQVEESVNAVVDGILAEAGPEACRVTIDFFSAFEPTQSHAT